MYKMSRLSMHKISEILRQRFELNCNYRDIARSLNISVGTISDCLSRARVAGLTWPLPEGLSEQDLYDRLYLPVSSKVSERPLPDWEYISKELRKKGMTLLLLWREYRDTHPNGLGYSRFCQQHAAHSSKLSPVMRQIHKAGEKIFVDYAGMKAEWINTITGEIHEAEIFVGCLGASQYIFAEATATQQLPDWIASHTRMFEFFGGVSTLLIPDNLKSGVTKAHRYDPDINTNYQHFSEHYGIAIVPARTYTPTDKAKAESAVSIVERQILAVLRHRTFTSIGEINQAIKELLVLINNKPFQKMQVSRRELFETLDKPALKLLPPRRYQYKEWKKAKVHMDYHVSFDHHFYSVPYQYIHKTIALCISGRTVEFYYEDQRIALHERSYKKYGYSTLEDHMPKAHQEYAKYSITVVMESLKKIGSNAHTFAERMMASKRFAPQAYRACYGLLRLGDRYGAERLEKACFKALGVDATRYQQIELILKNKLEEEHNQEPEHESLIVHRNIRGPDYFN